jgi:outer membrane protein assembly factor BamB
MALAWALSPTPVCAEESPREDLARFFLSQMKARKGLALDLGCGDASLAIALARQTELIIECVDSDPNIVAQARQAIDAADLYGTRITAAPGNFERLNYPSHCANLILCGDEFLAGRRGRDLRELYRVLSPNGIALIGRSRAAVKGEPLTRNQLEGWLKEAGITTYSIVEEHGVWARITRPPSPGWDEWTHRSHDPANTFGSEDTLKGPDFKVQWVSDYRPGLSSAAVAVTGGRAILASLSFDKFPETTPHIQVLDAFTGMELWARVGKKELPVNRPPNLYSNRESCSDIAVVGDRLYLLGGQFCHVFDLANGDLKQSFAIPAEAKVDAGDAWLYLACVGDLLYGAVGKAPGVKVDWNTMIYRGTSKAIFALERTTGRLRWINHTPASVCSLCLGGNRLFFGDAGRKLHALDASTGAGVWSVDTPYPAATEIARCSYYRDKVWLLYNLPKKDKAGNDLKPADLLTIGHNSRQLDAYAARDGKRLFEAPFGMKVAGVSFAGGQVFGSGQHGGEGVSVVDAETGELKWKSKASFTCTPSLATPNCFLSQQARCPSILDLLSLKEDDSSGKGQRVAFAGFRPSCSYPGLPANGMVYQQAEGCACASPLRGNFAFIPGKAAVQPVSNRLTKGSAFDQPIAAEERPVWASWRADHLRSGQTAETAPTTMELLWKTRLSGQLTPMAAGHDMVYCGSSDRKVYALDANTGKVRWQMIGSGRVQAAPYLWQGRLFCTDDDGWAFALRADSGASLWKFRAALGDERIVGYGGFMSRWPARTGALVHDDTAYFAAGLFPDEGTVVYAVDPRTGQLRWQKDLMAGKGGRTSGFVPDGAMALAHNRLYIPSGSGMPWYIDLAQPEHPASFIKGYHVKGHQIMVAGDDVLAVTPNLQYVHHVHYSNPQPDLYLPVIGKDTVYQVGKSLPYLVAAKKDAYQLSTQGAAFYMPRKDLRVPLEKSWRWKAWKNEPMSCLIATANVIFSGGPTKVYATAADDGKELWSAVVPSQAEDLAFHNGRLFVRCRSGELLCFGQPSK